jgi:enolase
MRTIQNICFIQILDSRGFPTIQCQINDGLFKACSPSGASTGSREAVEIRDGNETFMGKSVISAFKSQDLINETFIGKSLEGGLDKFTELDNLILKLDNTPQKSILGGNLTTALSFCLLKAVSNNNVYKLFNNHSLPRPLVNIINGGKHAGNKLQIQEFMIVPKEYTDVYDMLNNITTVFHNLKKIISKKYGSSQTAVGDEGGYAPDIESPEEALDLLVDAIQISGLRPGEDMFIALDCAASEYYKDGNYEILENKWFTREETIDYFKKLCNKYPIISIEDPFDENDFEGWKKFYQEMNDKIMIVGDDLFTTSPEYCKKNQEEKWANSLLVKVNQIGTVSQALDAIGWIRKTNGKIILSHRSGETNDDIITDIGYGIGAEFLKIGAPCRGERIAKYNRLIEIKINEKLEKYKTSIF